MKKSNIKKEYKDSIRIVNMSSYNTPEIKEVHNKEWVSFGNNNDYFDNLIERYLDSPTNGRCVNGIVDMIYGRGLESTNSEIFPEHYVRMKKLLRPREVKRLVNDYKLLGQGAMQLTYNKAKTKILKVSHFLWRHLEQRKLLMVR